MLATILVGLSSCNNDDIPNIDTSEYKTLSLRVSHDIATRGISESVTEGTPVVFNTGDLFLVNSDGVIVRHYNIVDRTSPTIDGNINRADFDSQVTIDNIPGQVVEVVVMANTGGNNTAGSINAIGKRVIDIVTQHDVTNVNLFGRAMFQPTGFVHPITGNDVHEANILLRPTVARFEIADITGAGQIESFTIEGIFIDRYYRKAQVGGTIPARSDNFVSNGQDADLFVFGSSAYPAALTPSLFDWRTWHGSRSTSLTVTPDNAGNVWAYQLFAQTDASADATTVPSIVVRIRDIRLRNGTQIQGARFLTIRGIYTQSGVLEGIKSGIVYRFPAGAIVFTERDLSPRPNENPIDARVTISLSNWNEEIVNVPRPYNPSFWVDMQGNRRYFTIQNTPMANFSLTPGRWRINGVDVTQNELREITFGDSFNSVVTIGNNFLRGARHLTGIDLRGFENVTSIRDWFMQDASALTEIDFSGFENVITIGGRFLQGATHLTGIDFSPFHNLTTIGFNFMQDASALTEIDFRGLGSVTSIGDSFLFRAESLQKITLSGLYNVTTIGSSFLVNAYSLTEVCLRGLENITTIEDSFLVNAHHLPKIDLSPLGNVTTIEGSFFGNAHRLTEVDLSPLGNVTTIGDNFFSRADRLERVNLNGLCNVTQVGSMFFAFFSGGRFSLREIIIGDVDWWSDVYVVNEHENTAFSIAASSGGVIFAPAMELGQSFRARWKILNLNNWTIMVQP